MNAESIFVGLCILLFLPSVSAVDFSTSESTVNVGESEFELEYSDIDLNGSVNVSYFNSSQKIGSSSTSPYDISFDSKVENFSSLDLSADASNSSSYQNKTKNLTLNVDLVKPSISVKNSTRLDNGSIKIYYDIEDEETSLENFNVTRNGEKIFSNSLDSNTSTVKVFDPNSERSFGTTFDYKASAEDAAGNIRVSSKPSLDPKDREPPTTSLDISSGETLNNQIKDDIEVTGTDELSGLEVLNVTIHNSWKSAENISGTDKTLSVNISNLDNKETYDISVNAEDDEGNSADYLYNFTVDRTPPEVEGSRFPGSEVIENETLIGVEMDDSNAEEVARMECYLDDNKIGEDDRRNSNDLYSCGKIDPEDYDEGEHDFKAIYYDNVGNPKTQRFEEFRFDYSKPVVDEVTVSPENYWKAPQISVEARDAGSELAGADYSFDDESWTDVGFDLNDKQQDFIFEPELQGISNGEKEIHVRVEDETGKISDSESAEFYLNSSSRPELALNLNEFVMMSNEKGKIQFEISNDADVSTSRGKVTFSSALVGSTPEFILNRAEAESFEINVSNAKKPGIYQTEVNFQFPGVNRTDQVKTIIKADAEQKQNIEYRIENASSKLEQLKTRVENSESEHNFLKESKVSERIKSISKRLDEMEEAVEDDKHYAVASDISDIEKEIESASKEHRQVQKQREQRKFILLGLGLLSSVIVLGGGYTVNRKTNLGLDDLKKSVLGYLPMNSLKRFRNFFRLSRMYSSIPFEIERYKLEARYLEIKNKIRRKLDRDQIDWKGYS